MSRSGSLLFLAVVALSATPGARAETKRGHPCPPEMTLVRGFCVDRWEISLVDRKTGQALSPYYPPSPPVLRRVREVWETERHNYGDAGARLLPLPDVPRVQRGRFEPLALSRAGVVPQGYLTYYLAKLACENAGKRLCSEEEWVTACRGATQKKFPYGDSFSPKKCNVHRGLHPAHVLHGDSSMGHTDPRLNLLDEDGRRALLSLTGENASCASRWEGGAIYDMVGNLDEWIEDASGVFLGGFYARATTDGCEAKIASHAPAYYDYSLGARCCADAR